MNQTVHARSLLDHVLVTMGCVFAVYSAGMAVAQPAMAGFMALVTVISSLIGFFIARSIEGTKLQQADAWLWAGLALTVWFFLRFWNRLLPGGGFEFTLIISSGLCWMIMLCSLVSWRDQTRLFLGLPSLALFGIVGTTETFAFGTPLFFGFLIAIGVFYARVHQRAMVQRARLAGETQPELLIRGPWKWAAGPEWALLSGISVVALSLIGAPVIQTSVKTVVGSAPLVSLPNNPQRNNNPQTPVTGQVDVRVGRGPINPSDAQVFVVKMDQVRLLRQQTYAAYNSGGWAQAVVDIDADSPLMAVRDTSEPLPKGPNGGLYPWPGGKVAAESISNPDLVQIEITPKGIMGPRMPAPGPVVELLDLNRRASFNALGDLVLDRTLNPGDTARFVSTAPPSQPPNDALARPITELASVLLAISNIRPRVAALAIESVANARTDAEKADAIQRAITSRVKYNLNAAPTPQGADPVENFLFGSKEGYCDLFASSMVLMSRQVGLPARYVVGWLPTPGDVDPQGRYIVREADYHAWAEIYFEGVGWVAYDATEGAESVPGGERGGVRQPNIFSLDNATLINVVGGVVILLLAAPLAYLAIRWLREQNRPENRTRSDLARHHAAFHLGIEKVTKQPKRFSQTLREYVDQSSDKLGDLTPEARGLVERFEESFFSPRPLDRTEIKALESDVSAFNRRLKEMAAAQKKAA